MKTSTKQGLAIAWLVIAALFGGVALLQLYCLLTGIYDPVAADGMSPERVPFLRGWLILVIVVSASSGLFALRYVWKKSKAAAAANAGEALWFRCAVHVPWPGVAEL